MLQIHGVVAAEIKGPMGIAETNDEQPTSQETEQELQRIAKTAKRLRLEAPLLFMIEAHLPLSTLIHTLGLMLQPTLGPLLGASRMHRALQLLADREHLERLAGMLEDEKDLTRKGADHQKALLAKDS